MPIYKVRIFPSAIWGMTLMLFAWNPLTWAQSNRKSEATRNQGAPQETLRTAHAVRVEHAPRLDGTIDDPLWREATPISEFLQREPSEGQSPTEKTEVRVLYTKSEVFFGVTCFDSAASGIVATELRRCEPGTGRLL